MQLCFWEFEEVELSKNQTWSSRAIGGGSGGEEEQGRIHIAMKTNGVIEEDIDQREYIDEEEEGNLDWALGDAIGDRRVWNCGSWDQWMLNEMWLKPGKACSMIPTAASLLLRMTDVSEDDEDWTRRSLVFLGCGENQIEICIITIIVTRNNALREGTPPIICQCILLVYIRGLTSKDCWLRR